MLTHAGLSTGKLWNYNNSSQVWRATKAALDLMEARATQARQRAAAAPVEDDSDELMARLRALRDDDKPPLDLGGKSLDEAVVELESLAKAGSSDDDSEQQAE